jgi:thiol:disulfide interchange protein DsbD
MKHLLISLIISLLSLPLFAQSGNDLLDIKFQYTEIKNRDYLSIQLQHEPGWHTYWKNPGESGLPIEFEFTRQGEKIDIAFQEWAIPKKHLEGGEILTYGYEDQKIFFVDLSEIIASNLQQAIGLEMRWLICKEICIPGKANFSFNSDGTKWTIPPEHLGKLDQKKLLSHFKLIPQKASWPQDLNISLNLGKEPNTYLLYYSLKNFDPNQFDQHYNFLTPFRSSLLSFKHEKLFIDPKDQTLHGMVEIDWDGQYAEPVVPFPGSGQLSDPISLQFLYYPNKSVNAVVVSTSFENISEKGDASVKQFLSTLTPIEQWKGSNKANSEKKEDGLSLWAMLLFAFLGGLILNLMPCVLPVISIKLFGLVQSSQAGRSAIIQHNLFYTLGVLFCFLILAMVTIALQASGESIGWGFQLQSPGFIIIILVVLFVFACNLFGLFEFRTPGSQKLGNVETKDGPFGHFLSGVLATILSTPCSAPFLGTALGFALTSSWIHILVIFMAIGLGLAFPFIVLIFVPQAIRFLPKPGQWMIGFKKFLGVSLLLTSFWLLDVLSTQITTSYIFFYLFPLLTLVFLLLQLYGHHQPSRRSVALLIMLLVTFGVLSIKNLAPNRLNDLSSGTSSTRSFNGVEWKAWNSQIHQELLQNKNLAFIDFTAKWCLTCQVNKKLIFQTEGFLQMIERNQIELYQADWTNRNKMIADWLAQRNLAGIPVYFLLIDGQEHFLGETTSISEIEELIKKIKK